MTLNGNLDERVALVTGGARGQGRSHAMALAAEGAIVVVCDIETQIATVPYPLSTRQDLNDTVDMIRGAGGKAFAAVTDVRDSGAVTELIDGIVNDHGRLDVLIANAGICNFSTIAELSDDT